GRGQPGGALSAAAATLPNGASFRRDRSADAGAGGGGANRSAEGLGNRNQGSGRQELTQSHHGTPKRRAAELVRAVFLAGANRARSGRIKPRRVIDFGHAARTFHHIRRIGRVRKDYAGEASRRLAGTARTRTGDGTATGRNDYRRPYSRHSAGFALDASNAAGGD